MLHSSVMTKSTPLTSLLADPQHPAAAALSVWLAAAPRFRAFVTAHATKIRKKLRQADPESLRDTIAELEAAFLLLRDGHFAISYEPTASSGRAPDLALRYKGHLPLNLEVTRMRRTEGKRDPAEKLSNVICAKLRQFPPGVINLLLVCAEEAGGPLDAGQAMVRLRERAAAGDDQFFARRAAGTARAFTRAARRLSGMLIRDTPGGAFALWENQTARHHLPDDLRRALVRAMGPADVL